MSWMIEPGVRIGVRGGDVIRGGLRKAAEQQRFDVRVPRACR